MNAIKTSLLSTAAILALSAPALAQDWDGFYAGGTLGFAAGNAVHTFSNGAPTDNSDPTGVLLGGFAGYAWQSGNYVYGGEIDLEWSDYNGSFVNTSGATSQGVVEGNWQGSIRGVVGIAGNLGGSPALYYLTAGYAVGDFDFLGGPSVPVPPGGGYSEVMHGVTAGFGMDVRVDQQTSFRVEYRYTNFGEASGALSPTFPGVTMPVDVEQHALRVGLRFEF